MNIYVGNLSYQATEEGIRGLFEQYGAVESVRVMSDKFTGKPRGFCFVSMVNDNEATAAIDALNNYEFEGRALRVSQANPPQQRTGGNGGPRRGGFGGPREGGFDRGPRRSMGSRRSF